MTQCSIPWTGFSNEPDGRVQPCCLFKGYIEKDNQFMYVQKHTVDEIFHSDYMKQLRQEFRDNKKPQACSTCWNDELNGYKSKRLVYNELHKDIDYSIEPEYVSELQLIISNSCNLKCRSCTPSHSTQWQQEFKIMTGDIGYKMPHGQSVNDTSILYEDRFNWYKNLTRLEVVGGEPFYVKQWHNIFNELIELGYSKNIDLTMTTNCTLFFPELIEKMANNFKSVSIGLSIDGIGKTYEYIRHPGKWDVVYNNMKQYNNVSHKINMQLNLTISWLNVLEVPEIHTLIKSEFPRFKIWNNLVHYPEFLAICNIPDSFKKDVEIKWNNYEFDNKSTMDSVIKYMNSKSITLSEFKENLKHIYSVDKFRGESLTESIPFLKKYT